MKKIKGYKGYDKGLKCKDKQYDENKVFEEDLKPEACSKGMHFCEMPLDVFSYYPPKIGVEYTEVESLGDYVKDGDKVSTNKLKVKGKISISSLFKAHFDILFDKIKSFTGNEAHSITTGNQAHSSTTGNQAHSITTGYKAHSITTGEYAHSITTGEYAHSSTTGEYAHSSTTGNQAHSSTTGEYAHSSTTGDKALSSTTGYYAHSITTGYKAHSSTTGNQAHSSTTGYYAHSSTTGYYAHSSTTGYYAHSSTTGEYAHSSTTGNEAISSSLGFESKSMAEKGWIVIVDWRLDGEGERYIKDIFRAKVGEHKIKGHLIQSNTLYWFEKGELKCEKQ